MLSNNAKEIFTKLYSLPGEEIDDVFMRTSQEFSKDEKDGCCKIAFDLQKENIFRPNTPVFFNAGGNGFNLFSACWVINLEDSMDSIYEVVDSARKIFQHGAGIGIPVGNLREKDAFIYENNHDTPPIGKSSGPISFMTLFDAVGETTKSGGRARRAAIMCAMPVSHPDVMDFIKCKEEDGRLSNMNISVVVDDKFMKALDDNVSYPLISPNGNKQVGEIDPKMVWDKLSETAWKTGDPGVLFIDTINRMNPLKKIKLIQTSNPCGEQTLIPDTACNLSAINVSKFIENGEYNYDKLFDTAYNIMTLMDNLIDKMDFPTDAFKKTVLKYRPVGIGPMGVSDTLYELGVKYDSIEGRELAGKIMKTITSACVLCSSHLAKERGKFADYDIVKDDTEEIISKLIDDDAKIMKSVRENGLRNITHTTAAPTGSTALSCDCSYGMEPCFGLVFQKNLIDGGTMHMINPIFREKYENEEWFNDALLNKIVANGGSLKGLRGIPKEVRDVFVVAHDIKYKDRIDMQSILQSYISSAISSTINLPSTATAEEISNIYKYAYEKELKGITVYRDGCKQFQPVTFTKTVEGDTKKSFKRPSKLTANVHTVETGNGKLYVTVSTYNDKPVEVFMNMGKSGQTFNVFSEALGRAISIALQQGVSVDDIISTLDGINSDRVAWHRFEESDKRPTQILSIPDAIAKLLNRYYSGASDKENTGTGSLCAKCGTYSVMKVEGCAVCQNCGDSHCG